MNYYNHSYINHTESWRDIAVAYLKYRCEAVGAIHPLSDKLIPWIGAPLRKGSGHITPDALRPLGLRMPDTLVANTMHRTHKLTCKMLSRKIQFA